MTTPERLSADPSAEVPLSPDELARLAGQVYAQLSGVVLGSPPAPTLAGGAAAHVPSLPESGIGATAGWPGSAEASAVAATAALTYPRPVRLPEFTAFSVPDVSDALGSTYGDRTGGPRGSAIPHATTTFDVVSLRRDFPILAERVNGRPLVWLDNAATTHKPEAVIERIAHFYRHENSNVHRAAHELAARATEAYEEARETVRRFIGASRTEEIVFVRGATEAINLVAWSWGAKHIGEGDEIVITHLEHHANIVPWQLLAQRTGAVLKIAPVDDSGTLLLGELERLVGPRTRLVAATQVSNALGTVTPVREIVEIAHRHGARVLIDGAQSVPHTAVDVRETGADFFVFSGHKVFGPTGIGVLYGREDALAETPPWQSGGNMIADVTHERSIFQGPPNTFEAGTGNIADAVGLGAALRYVEQVGIDRITRWEHRLVAHVTPRLAEIAGLRLVGTSPEKASVVSFVIDGHDTVRIGQRLNEEHGIAVRAGHHCAQPILRRLGVETTVRPSFAFYNTIEEADLLVEALRGIAATPGA